MEGWVGVWVHRCRGRWVAIGVGGCRWVGVGVGW